MEIVVFLLLAITFALGGSFAFEAAGRKKSHILIQEWATGVGVKIDKIDQPLFDTGPYTFPFSKVQRIYRVSVLEQDRTKVYWARTGHRWLGLFRPELEIKSE